LYRQGVFNWGTRIRTGAFSDEKQGLRDEATRKTTHAKAKDDIPDNLISENTEFREPNDSLQNPAITNPTWLVTALCFIPAEYQANFLRALADQLDHGTRWK
jgi:hypothetical protein